MANANNLHPISGPGSGIMTALRSNPIGAFLAGMLLLAAILPARKRKYRPKKKRSRKRRKGYRVNPGNPLNPGKKSKRKGSKKTRSPAPRRASGPRRSTKAAVPAWRVKGSPEARAHMAKLRAKRK